MTEVEIEYCVPCGLLDNAQKTQYEILSEFGRKVDGVRLKTGEGGVFKIRVDGEEIYDKNDEAYDIEAIKGRVGEHLETTA